MNNQICFCPYCGKDLRTKDNYCGYCNKVLPKSSKYCSYCGKLLKQELIYCSYCGVKLPAPEKNCEVDNCGPQQENPFPKMKSVEYNERNKKLLGKDVDLELIITMATSESANMIKKGFISNETEILNFICLYSAALIILFTGKGLFLDSFVGSNGNIKDEAYKYNIKRMKMTLNLYFSDSLDERIIEKLMEIYDIGIVAYTYNINKSLELFYSEPRNALLYRKGILYITACGLALVTLLYPEFVKKYDLPLLAYKATIDGFSNITPQTKFIEMGSYIADGILNAILNIADYAYELSNPDEVISLSINDMLRIL